MGEMSGGVAPFHSLCQSLYSIVHYSHCPHLVYEGIIVYFAKPYLNFLEGYEFPFCQGVVGVIHDFLTLFIMPYSCHMRLAVLALTVVEAEGDCGQKGFMAPMTR